MSRHLLGKKSWNVYDPKNIARVKRDEAAAEAKEAEEERLMQEVDNERRLAILRGEAPPPLPPDESESQHKRDTHDDRSTEYRRERKRRRLAGEDDTERDIRLAREDLEIANGPKDRLSGPQNDKRNVPIADRECLMDLFPEERSASQKKAAQRAEDDAAKRRREKEQEEQLSMRFADAAGKNGLKQDPWYKTTNDIGTMNASGESKDVWGRPDPRRKEREQARIASDDPFAAMKQAQKQFKQAQTDKAEWEERQRELKRMRKEEERRQRKEERKRRRNHDDFDELEGFSLDVPAVSAEDEGQAKTHHRTRRRSRDQSREKSHRDRRRHRTHSTEQMRDSRGLRRHRSRDTSRQRLHHHEHRRTRSKSRDRKVEGTGHLEKYSLLLSPPPRRESDRSRPETSTAVASRLIAGALGMKTI